MQNLPTPSRLQGTDGIRGKVSLKEVQGLNPLQGYLQTGLLTPAFFELYAYSFGMLLQAQGTRKEEDPLLVEQSLVGKIVVGWDSRDPENHFNHAAVQGLQKAGLEVVIAGVLPTPAMPLYMMEIQAQGAVVLTASHNPADQNGIKLFWGDDGSGKGGMKFLPEEDEALTAKIAEVQDLDLASLPLQGKKLEEQTEIKDFFVTLMQAPQNSWAEESVDFSDTLLVVDASNGACSTVAADTFEAFSFQELHFTNLQGAINQDSGVAEIEGKETITTEEIIGPDAPYAKFETFTKLHELSQRERVVSGSQKLAALVFDGDGDRCFIVHYEWSKKHFVVLSGDALGILQARYLAAQGKRGLFVNTVESDLALSLEVASLGFTPMVTGVGDKWILAQACSPSPQATAQTPFQIGLEESGHAITATILPSGKTAYAGNGIKAGINSLVALQQISNNDEEYFQWINHPFPAGVKETFYVYYVDKALLEPNTAFRKAVEAELLAWAKELLPSGFEAKMKFFPEETSLVYCGFFQGDQMQGAAFVRNSGTEDKSSLYLRGTKELGTALEELGKRLHLYALQNLKSGKSTEGKLEAAILQALQEGKALEPVIAGEALSARVLKEMERKQGLILKQAGAYQLTEKGKAIL